MGLKDVKPKDGIVKRYILRVYNLLILPGRKIPEYYSTSDISYAINTLINVINKRFLSMIYLIFQEI